MRDKHRVIKFWLSALLILAGCAGDETRSHGPEYVTYSDSDWEQHRAENAKVATDTMAAAMKGT